MHVSSRFLLSRASTHMLRTDAAASLHICHVQQLSSSSTLRESHPCTQKPYSMNRNQGLSCNIQCQAGDCAQTCPRDHAFVLDPCRPMCQAPCIQLSPMSHSHKRGRLYISCLHGHVKRVRVSDPCQVDHNTDGNSHNACNILPKQKRSNHLLVVPVDRCHGVYVQCSGHRLLQSED